ncbi:hypothetical protein JCM15519_25170 [Fundidesulfovibrio butyratiphilus]
MRRFIVLAFVALALCACTKPPYQKPQASIEDLDADYQDCYSLGALKHYTPGQTVSVEDATKSCMRERGYQPACLR